MKSLKEYLEEHHPDEEFLIADGLDDAFIGVGHAFNQALVCYDVEKVIRILRKDGMSREDAQEYFDFNIAGAYMGENTPVFIEVNKNWRKE